MNPIEEAYFEGMEKAAADLGLVKESFISALGRLGRRLGGHGLLQRGVHSLGTEEKLINVLRRPMPMSEHFPNLYRLRVDKMKNPEHYLSDLREVSKNTYNPGLATPELRAASWNDSLMTPEYAREAFPGEIPGLILGEHSDATQALAEGLRRGDIGERIGRGVGIGALGAGAAGGAALGAKKLLSND